MAIYAFDDFRVDEGARALTRSGAPVPMTPRIFDTLLHLVRRGGELVGKDELMRAVWPRRVVEENNLDQSISALRRALGDGHGVHRYILTVPGKGYRFVAALDVSSAGDAAPDAKPLRTLAVLPFQFLREPEGDGMLALGMADTLITRLSGLGMLVVRPLSAVRHLGALAQDPCMAGRSLGVDAVLDGSVQRQADRIRVSMRLSNIAQDRQQWGEIFDAAADDLFALQDRVAEQAVAALALRLNHDQRSWLTRRHTGNPEAWRCYSLGRYCLDQRSPDALRQAATHFRHALALDPDYVLAWTALSDAYAVQGVFGAQPPGEVYPSAREAALRALALDERWPLAHAALGHVLLQFEHDWVGAEKAYRCAIELDPHCTLAHHRYAILLMTAGRPTEAFAHIRRARALDPTSLPIDVTEGFLHYWARDYPAAIAHLQATLARAPHFWMAHYWLAQVQGAHGDFAAAIASARQARELVRHHDAWWLLAWALARAGRAGAARQCLAELLARSREHYVPPYDIAQVYAGLGDAGQVFEWLERAWRNHSRGLDNLAVNPVMDAFRDDPRMASLRARIGPQ